MKREEQELYILWIEPKISQRFLDFITKKVYSPDDDFTQNSTGTFHYKLDEIRICVRQNNFKLDPEDENFFELGKEMNVDYVEFFIC